MRLAFLLLALLLFGSASSGAAAQDALPQSPQELLYLQALRALSNNQPEEASTLLMRFLADEPQHAGAWLDLAISQCELGNTVYAEQLFEDIVHRFSPPPGILEVIDQQRARGCHGRIPRAQYALSVAIGYDNNVNQGASNPFFYTNIGGITTTLPLKPEYLPKPDHYSQLLAEYSRPLNNSATIGFAQLRARKHHDLHEQNTTSLLLGLDQPWKINAWQGGATAFISWLQLNDQYYQRQTQLQLRVSPPLALPPSMEWSLNAGLSRVSYPGRLNDDTTTIELGNKLHFHADRYKVTASAGILSDQGHPLRLGGDRKGWYSNALLYALLTEQLKGQLSFSQQSWHGRTAYAPGSIDVVRRQNMTQLNAGLTWPITRAHSLQLEWRVVRNRENISLLEYKSRTVQLSWRWDNF